MNNRNLNIAPKGQPHPVDRHTFIMLSLLLNKYGVDNAITTTKPTNLCRLLQTP